MERTSIFYLANLGSEVHRIFVLKEKGLFDEANKAHIRAIGIIEKLLIHPELEGRTEEIEILKNYLEESVRREKIQFFKEEWRKYFSPYANRLSLMNK